MIKSFAVVIPSYKNAPWCRQNLDSVLRQEYEQFRVIYIDDCSPDDTASLVQQYLDASPHSQRVTFWRNEKRVGAVANIDRAIRFCDPSEIVVLVDGDDFLSHPRVLARLNQIYQDPDVWVTWGQFTPYPQGGPGFCAPIPSEIVSANAYRDHPFVSSHLRTFYASLYQRIRLVDLKDGDGKFFVTGGDVAQMFALLEMAGPRGRFLAEVLYEYNRENPINDDKVDRSEQLRREMEIRGKARYGRVRNLDSTDPPNEVCIGAGIGRTLFDVGSALSDADQRRRPFRQLRTVLNRLGFTVRESQTFRDIEEPHTIASFDVRPEELERLSRYPRGILNLILWRDPISAPQNFNRRHHEAFERIYTWCDDLVDNVRYFKLHLPFLRPMIDDVVPFENRRHCALIASSRYSDHPDELYSEERRVAQYFAETDGESFDLFGSGWSRALNPSFRSSLLGRIAHLRRYRFSLCYETVKGWNGFVSAKIFDSFAAGCVPVYLGAPNIAASIPRECFIAREDFASDAELHSFLRDMPAQAHARYVESIRAFLTSDRAVPYSAEHFVRTLVEMVGRSAPVAHRVTATQSRGLGRGGSDTSASV